MYIHKEGRILILVILLLSVFIPLAFQSFLGISGGLLYFIAFVCAVFFLLILQFFRNPSRNIVPDVTKVIAPADGKVVVIERVREDEYLKDERIQVSIFMSPINVHVNRNPVGGLVKYFKYHPGKYLVAWHPKSSTENERTTLVIETENKIPVLVRQIAGALAKRIKWYVKEGDKVNQGAEFGFIKFGSRVDLFLPLNADIQVQLNQKTIGGETVIATID